MEDRLSKLLKGVEQAESDRFGGDFHSPEFRLLTELVNRVMELETLIRGVMEHHGLSAGY